MNLSKSVVFVGLFFLLVSKSMVCDLQRKWAIDLNQQKSKLL